MGLMDSLRKAEQQGRNTARKGFGKARAAWDDAETRLRRKMRLHPRPAPLPNSIQPPITSSSAAAQESLPNRASEEDAA